MKKTVLAVLAFALACGSSFAGDMSKEEMTKKMMEYGTPGEGHQIFKKMTGKWNYTSKWWESADKAPEESSGSSMMKLALGGRFLQQDVKGKMMGMPFEGVGFIGYDNLKKKYETIWMDSMMTGIMKGEGEYDAKTQTLADAGEHTCPISEDHKRKYRSELKIVDKNHLTWVMYGPDKDGKEFKNGEMMYTRGNVVTRAKK